MVGALVGVSLGDPGVTVGLAVEGASVGVSVGEAVAFAVGASVVVIFPSVGLVVVGLMEGDAVGAVLVGLNVEGAAVVGEALGTPGVTVGDWVLGLAEGTSVGGADVGAGVLPQHRGRSVWTFGQKPASDTYFTRSSSSLQLRPSSGSGTKSKRSSGIWVPATHKSPQTWGGAMPGHSHQALKSKGVRPNKLEPMAEQVSVVWTV